MEQLTFPPHSALIVVDVQNDFCPGGSLAVPDGDQIIPVVQHYVDSFTAQGLPVIFTRDFHPANHVSFAQQGGPWPPHCVQETVGVDYHPGIKIPPGAYHIIKGFQSDVDAYSGFEGRLRDSTDSLTLDNLLHSVNVHEIYLVGLATDYCVHATAFDALRLGYRVIVVEDGVRGVNVNSGDSLRALQDLRQHGAQLISSTIRP